LKRQNFLVGIFMTGLGIFGVFIGIRYLLGLEAIITGGGLTCRSICGLGLIVTELLGARAAQLLVGTLFLLAGIWLTWFGYHIILYAKKAVK
jgi:hypothetical protein